MIEDLITRGKNIFLTGGAGVGKTFQLKKIIKYFYDRNISIGVTGTTGKAAKLIGGSTVHSWSGIGTGVQSIDDIIQAIRSKPYLVWRWRKVKCLIIDEISMLNADVFTKLDTIARVIRQNSRIPFGGIQLIVSGDFLQLPPVEGKFCFEASRWTDCFESSRGKIVTLTKVYRQDENEVQFVDILNRARVGALTDADVEYLTCNSKQGHADTHYTKLFCKRKNVDKENREALNALTEKLHIFEASDRGIEKYKRHLSAKVNAPAVLHLKKNALVMLTKNISYGKYKFVNGSRGKIIDIYTNCNFNAIGAKRKRKQTITNSKCVIVQFFSEPTKLFRVSPIRFEYVEQNKNGKPIVRAFREQVPLVLAYSSTIHKLQGASLDGAQVMLKDVFLPGQSYVALSRVRSLSELYISDIKPEQLKANTYAHKKALDFYSTHSDSNG